MILTGSETLVLAWKPTGNLAASRRRPGSFMQSFVRRGHGHEVKVRLHFTVPSLATVHATGLWRVKAIKRNPDDRDMGAYHFECSPVSKGETAIAGEIKISASGAPDFVRKRPPSRPRERQVGRRGRVAETQPTL